MTSVSRTALPEPFNPASGKTVTITVTLRLRPPAFRETQASRMAAQIRELAKQWGSFADSDKTVVEIEYAYPQWKRTYGPDPEPRSGGDHE